MRDGDDIRGDIVDSHDRARVKAALFGKPADAQRKIGRFTVGRILGRGGMGTVHAARDEELERDVAIKLLHPGLWIEHRERLRREAVALAKLSHPNVVQVYEVGQHEAQTFVAMEYVAGATLRQWLETERDVSAVVETFTAAGRGLGAAHARDLVHRDFKPDNVLVGADGRPRIVDFGLARLQPGDSEHPSAPSRPGPLVQELEDTDEPKLGSSLTSTGAIVGTPAYMSPEQFLGRPATAASDQFSFCVALWEALYRARPFPGKRLRELADAVCNAVPVVANLRGPSGVVGVLRRGLAKDPAARWPSMEALLEALARQHEGPRRRRRVGLISIAGATTVGAFAWAMSRPDPVQATDDREGGVGCPSIDERLAGVWDEPTKANLRARYTASDGSGKSWWAYEEALLNDWVDTWTRIYEDSCEAAEQDLTRFALVQDCLHRRMIEIRTRVELAQRLEPDLRARAGSNDYAPFSLPSECTDDDILRSVILYPPDAAARREILDAMTRFRVAEGLAMAAFVGGTQEQMVEGRELFLRAEAEVVETGFDPAIA